MNFSAKEEAFSSGILKPLTKYKNLFENELSLSFALFQEKNAVNEACIYALTSGGKRFRPALVYMVADSLGKGANVTHSAMAVEFFHTASLIIDDLPCQDNDDFRRGRRTVHKVFGEANAILASLALIAAGYEHIAQNNAILRGFAKDDTNESVLELSILQASKQMGILGLIGGQHLDLFESMLDRQKMLEIIERKTVCLFNLSFTLGWLFGGGSKESLPLIQKAALHFGTAFQILDDLDDMQKDLDSGTKTNYANLFGKDEAIQVISDSIQNFQEVLSSLKISSQPLSDLVLGMKNLALSLR